jgi:hypothetical protein
VINPENYAKANTEHAHQVALFMWANLPEQRELYPELKNMFAIPNGGERNKIVAARLKAEGVKSGVPDIFLPVARKKCNGLFIELKKDYKQPLSEKQIEWRDKLLKQGYHVARCNSWVEAKKLIILYLSY